MDIDFHIFFVNRPDFSFKEHIDNLDSAPKVKSIIQRENKSLDDRDVCITGYHRVYCKSFDTLNICLFSLENQLCNTWLKCGYVVSAWLP